MPTLDWIGKKAVLNHHREVPYHLLQCNEELSVGSPDSGNLLMEGDNLVALKALLPYYAGQVKCIYIDPPYNTGNENWVYNDAVNSPEMRTWLGKVVGGEAEDLSRHDKWLCMIYPRLALLKEFLREDGAIFVSIDDNEVATLRMIMDEIFGKRNFVAQFVWNTEGHTDNQFHVKINHEYIVIYARKESKLRIGYVIDPNTRQESNLWSGFAENSITKNGPANPPSEIELPVGFPVKTQNLDLPPSEIPDGLIRCMRERGLASNQLKAEFGRIQFPLRLDYMIASDHRLTKPCRVFSGWANANKLQSYIAGGCEPTEDDDGLIIRFFLSKNGVIYYHKERGEQARNILSVLRNMGTTEKMRSELESMGLHFGYPKPKELIKYILKTGSGNDDLILDSFAGSGTTAQAVLEMNAEGANRKFILIEMEPKIATDVTAQRLKKVVEGYMRKGDDITKGTGGGFRYCTLSLPLFDGEGAISRHVKFADLAAHLYFTETGQPLPDVDSVGSSPLLGLHEGVAIYLLFNGILGDKAVNGGNVLTAPVLASLPPHDGPKIIYGEGNRLGIERMRREGIIFKQIPYRIRLS